MHIMQNTTAAGLCSITVDIDIDIDPRELTDFIRAKCDKLGRHSASVSLEYKLERGLTRPPYIICHCVDRWLAKRMCDDLQRQIDATHLEKRQSTIDAELASQLQITSRLSQGIAA
jgi:hypothetical protein